MSNTLGYYNPAFFANEALIWLKKGLGLASRINLQYDAERRTYGRGDVVNIKRPGTFTAQDGPSTAQDMATESVQVSLSSLKEVKFKIDDKSFAYTQDRIITDHIMPAAYALADKIDQDIAALATTIPHAYVEPTAGAAATIAGILNTRKQMFDNKVPLRDEAMMHFMIGGKEEADLLALAAFSQWQGSAQTGVDTQLSGYLGRRYGFEFFANQNRGTVTYADISDFAGAVNDNTDPDKGTTSLAVDALGTAETYKKGTILTFTSGAELGNQYAVTADVTMSSGAGTFVINPGLRVGCLDNATFAIGDLAALKQGAAGTGAQDLSVIVSPGINNVNFAFHRDWAGLVFAPLPTYEQFSGGTGGLGVNSFTVQDPVTGISLRARMFLLPNTDEFVVALDCLYGVKEFNPDLACRYEIKNT